MLKQTVCSSCFGVFENNLEFCPWCEAGNLTHNNEALLQYGIDLYFQAYQNRKNIEAFIAIYGDQYRPNFQQHSPSEILGWVALACASGLTWDLIKHVVVELYKSSRSTKTRILSPYFYMDYPSPDESIIERFIEDDEDVKELVRYIEEYTNEFTDTEVHELVKADTFFLQQELIQQNEVPIEELGICITTSIKNTTKK